MEFYADVIVNISVRSVDKVFRYRIPEHLSADVRVGSSVTVPFGSRNADGVVIAVDDKPGFDESRIKDIISVNSGAPAADSQLIRLAAWMRSRYGGTMAQALKTVMPVKRSVREKKTARVSLDDRDKASAYYKKIENSRRERARARLLKALLASDSGSISMETAAGVLQIPRSTISSLEKAGMINIVSRQIIRGQVRKISGRWHYVDLNEEQQSAADGIYSSYLKMQADIRSGRRPCLSDMVHLLYGITGSGKTEVYMALMEKILDEGRQVIVLIPEISLTLQTVSRFYDRFGDRIAILNSRLSAGERYDQYMRAERGDASIMIGPRSALFTPFSNTGLIIIDEEHEAAYKSETAPRYLARDAAIERARMSGAAVILGSATPSLSTYYNAASGKYSIHTLSRRAKEGAALPQVQIVDLREEFKSRNMSILSRPLKEAVKECLERGEQIMLFINRRGYAGFVSCRSCGYVFKCRHCDVSMTIHGKDILKCHYCGSTMRLPRVCPECGSPYIAGFGLGTQKVEEVIRKEFPDARVIRMDRDTTAGKDDMGRLLQTFSDGAADILIGTQMIVKGHDFDRVTLVGIIAADLSMFSGDYLSSERTFQLLTQAAGRAGRGSRPGHVIIQTYRPDDYCIQSAADQDYEGFYQKEIVYRQQMHYPPVYHMLMLTIESSDDNEAKNAAGMISECIRRMRGRRLAASDSAGHDHLERTEGKGYQSQFQILGPSRAMITRIKDRFRYVIYVKSADEELLIGIREGVRRFASENERAFRKVYLGSDTDPYSLY